MSKPTQGMGVNVAVALIALGLASCIETRLKGETENVEEDHAHGGGAAVTIWTDEVELFFEYPPMVSDAPSDPWAIHLTFLDDFQPVREGRLTLRFVGADGNEYENVAAAPARDGIFTPTPWIPVAGTYDVIMTLDGPRGEARIPIGEIRVFGSSSDLPHVDEAPAAGISFLKEQQWTIPFSTAIAVERELPRTIAAIGEILPRPNAVGRVTAPVEGIVLPEQNLSAPVPGAWVEAGERVAVLSPVPEENAYAGLRAKVERLEREVERAERLNAVEAIPERRLVEARHDLEVSRAALASVGGAHADGYDLVLTAPINGVVMERNLTVGERVDAGQPLFSIVDPGTLWLWVQVPARDASLVPQVAGASFTVEGNARVYEDARLVSVGAAIDPERRTLPVMLEARNRDGSLKVGMLVEAFLFLESTARGIAIPSRALRKEDGLDVAYVQLGGETFERRVLVLGPSDGEWTIVDSGLRPGEHVVTEGAYQVRLASLNASEIADHGHPH